MVSPIFMEVSKRFDTLLANLTLTDAQRADGETKHHNIRTCLNQYYYNSSSDTANSLLVGSWGKATRIRPPRDIDVIFALPYEVYTRYETKSGNRQSQLLQEVKRVLEASYSLTTMRADGQVILIPFVTFTVEVVPGFKLTNGQYWICDTNGGGKYKKADPIAEIKNISDSNSATNNNTRDFIRMLKRWQDFCNVPLESFWIELLTIEFLNQWKYKGNTSVYYDWMIRDFFQWLSTKSGHYLIIPGTYDVFGIGGDWVSKAESAYGRAKKACENESEKLPYSAGEEWQKIFGDFIPTG